MKIQSRRDYNKYELEETNTPDNPFQLFSDWYAFAEQAEINEPYTMTLATANSNGRPSARVVLLRKYDPEGFSFFTNYRSKKGQHISENNLGALLFFWYQLERQIRIEGKIVKTSDRESTEYFNQRPRGSRLGAWASLQSTEIPSRKFLEDQYKDFNRKYRTDHFSRPDFWGGYKLIPDLFEFWQGRDNRLHDRIEYNLIESSWKKRRLAP